MRLEVAILLLILSAPMIGARADHPEVSRRITLTLDEDRGDIRPVEFTFLFVIRYPDGTETDAVGNDIPHSVTVPSNSLVFLNVHARVNEKGTYTAESRVYTITDLPANQASDERSNLNAGAGAKQGTGEIWATAHIRECHPSLKYRLYVTYSKRQANLGEAGGETVTVTCSGPTTTSTFTTLIHPLPTIPPTLPPWFSPTSTAKSTTSPPIHGSGTTTGMDTETRQSEIQGSTTSRGLSLNPSFEEVDAGDVAHFDLCIDLDNPSFRLEGLPTGYRYVVSRAGNCYKLKVFTHPLSYGRFDMALVVRSGDIEERADFSVLVRRSTSSSTGAMGTGSTIPSTSIPGGNAETSSKPSSSPSPPQSSQAQTVVTVTSVVEEPSEDFLLPLGGLAGVLALLAVLLIKRRR